MRIRTQFLLAFGLATAVPGAATAGLFEPRFLSFDTGSNPQSVAIGDLNGDGKPDLVTANAGSGSGTVSVLLGNGDGSFAPKTDFGTGNYPQSVAIGDLNGDGKPDLVTTSASSGPGTASVLLGNGNGSFRPRTDFGTGSNPYFVAIGDLNGDGKPDLAVANAYAYTVSVLPGGGDGSFGPKTDYGTGNYPRSVAIGDLDGDGKPDLVTSNAGPSTVSVWLGNGDESFGPNTEFRAGSNPVAVAIGDVNGDGKPDLAVANAGTCSDNFGTVSVWPGNGDGSFGPRSNFGTAGNPRSVAIGDLNGDGKPDLVTANASSGPGTVSVLLGNGVGSFGPKTDFGTGTYPYSVAIGDFNGDGKPDLVTANNGSNTVSILLGNGDGSFGPSTDFATGDSYSNPVSVAIGDLDRDGRPDLAVANSGHNTVAVLLGNGDGSFGPKTEFGTGSYCYSVAIGDLNRDGKPDLVTTNAFYSNTVSVLLGNGDGSFGPNTDFGTAYYPQSVAIGDMNGDGKPDLVTANPGSGTVSVLPGSGDGSFGPRTDFGTGCSPPFVAIGDLNGDGKPDLAVANSGTYPDCSGQYYGTVSVLLNTGTPPAAVEVPALPTRIELASNPNPFRSRATFHLAIPRSAVVRLEIYDVEGRSMRILQDGMLAPGRYARTWDGATTSGAAAPAGIYFVRLTSPGIALSRQTVLVR